MTKRAKVIAGTARKLMKQTYSQGTVIFRENGSAYYLVALYTGSNGPLTEDEKEDITREIGGKGRAAAGPGSTQDELRTLADSIDAALKAKSGTT